MEELEYTIDYTTWIVTKSHLDYILKCLDEHISYQIEIKEDAPELQELRQMIIDKPFESETKKAIQDYYRIFLENMGA